MFQINDYQITIINMNNLSPPSVLSKTKNKKMYVALCHCCECIFIPNKITNETRCDRFIMKELYLI